MNNNTIITVPITVKKLSEIFNIDSEYGDTLPKNCLFDKVTTRMWRNLCSIAF